MPVVSVCIPTYEPNPDHLKATIESVLKQTFSDWELIVNDDASKTDVASMVRPFLADSRIRFFRGQRNLEIGGNWNATMKKGSAPLVAYLFQDDFWHKSYLERSVKILHDATDIGFTAANHSYLIEAATAAANTGIYKEVEDVRGAAMQDGRIIREDFLRMWIDLGLRPNLIGEPSFVVLRRTTMECVGPFLEDMKQGLDVEYWIRCLLKSDGWWIADNLGSFRVHRSATTARNEESGSGTTDRLRTFNILIAALPDGSMKELAKKSRRRELLKMAWKFVRRMLIPMAPVRAMF